MTVIELGEVSSGSPEPELPERPVRMRDVRWFAVVAIVVLCVLGAGGSAVPPEPRGLRTLWSRPYGPQPFSLEGDTLYLFRVDDKPGVDAYDAETGRVLWHHRLERPIDWVYTWVPGIVMLPILAQQADGSETLETVVALDARTGRTLWQRRGDPAFGDERGLMLTEPDRPGGAVARMHMIRPSDGAELWSYAPAEPISVWSMPTTPDGDRPEWIATADGTGRVELRRTSDGSVMIRGKVPWMALEPENPDGNYAYLFAAGDTLASVLQKDGVQTMYAFDINTMRQIWTWTGDGRGGSFPCGPLICLGERLGVEAVDPATGRTVWRRAGFDYARPLDDTRMLFESHNDNMQGVLDVRTGELLTTFMRGMVVDDPANADVVVLAFSAEKPVEMAVYRLRRNNLELRGGMGGSTDQGCQFANTRLVCMMGSGADHTLVVRAVG